MVEEGDESLLSELRIKSEEQNGWMEIVCFELNSALKSIKMKNLANWKLPLLIGNPLLMIHE